jgi:hypothetical protein
MASPQFLEMLHHLHATGEQQRLRWEPVQRTTASSYCDFYLALGSGVLRLTSNEDDEESYGANYAVTLFTRDGLIVDEFATGQFEASYSTLLRDLYRQARSAAFNRPRLLEERKADLAAGASREIPREVLAAVRDRGAADEFREDEEFDIPF